jgi:hypothetical protein
MSIPWAGAMKEAACQGSLETIEEKSIKPQALVVAEVANSHIDKVSRPSASKSFSFHYTFLYHVQGLCTCPLYPTVTIRLTAVIVHY